LKRKIITTGDGSTTIRIVYWDEQYHSKHGAIQEAYHVFIQNGLALFKNQKLHILEIGFGTGLNAFISFLEGAKANLNIDYYGVEAFPVSEDELLHLNYVEALGANSFEKEFQQMHNSAWESFFRISPNFRLKKLKKQFQQIADQTLFHLIYFDAFGARVQPELWTTGQFRKMYVALQPGGVLVTYAAKGSVRRAMQEVGFIVERLPGPPGKREMLRASKPN